VSRRGWILFAAMCVIWGVPYLLIRVADRELAATTIVFLRTGIGAALLLPLAVRNGQLSWLRRRWRPFVAYTLFEVTLPWWLLTTAERHLTSSLAGLIVAVVPLLGVIVNRLARGDEVVDRRRLAGLLLGLVGVALLVGLQIGHVDLVAVGAVLLTALGYAIGPIILSRRMADLPGTGVVAASLVLTAVVYAPFAAVSWPEHVSGEVIAAVVVLAALCTAVAFLVFFALIRLIGPTRATVVTYVNPAVALGLGVLALGEPVTVGMLVGFPLVIAGSVLATRRGGGERRVPPSGAPLAVVGEP
jgi:drug/metabolite transporter (DMT)-like permease